MFSILDSSNRGRKRSGGAFMCGLLIHILVLGGAFLVSLLFPSELPLANRHFALAWIPFLKPPEKPVVEPPRKVARVIVPDMKPRKALEFPTPPVPDLMVPKIRPTISSTPLHIPEPPLPAPPVAQPSPPPKPQPAVHAGLFSGMAGPVTTKRPAGEVQTGGFGSPQALPGHAQGDNPGNLPKMGSFGLPAGPGVGNGTGGSHGIQGVIASAGFGNGTAGIGNGHGDGGSGGARVTTGGFENTGKAPPSPTESPGVTKGGFEKVIQVASSPAKNLSGPLPAEFQPVEILSKPTPVYTEEARRLGIQGEVVLSVIFQANGAIRVISVVRSLGHGLDQAAEQAAAHIRFKPAQRAGQPADFPATLRIEFRLADQST